MSLRLSSIRGYMSVTEGEDGEARQSEVQLKDRALSGTYVSTTNVAPPDVLARL